MVSLFDFVSQRSTVSEQNNADGSFHAIGAAAQKIERITSAGLLNVQLYPGTYHPNTVAKYSNLLMVHDANVKILSKLTFADFVAQATPTAVVDIRTLYGYSDGSQDTPAPTSGDTILAFSELLDATGAKVWILVVGTYQKNMHTKIYRSVNGGLWQVVQAGTVANHTAGTVTVTNADTKFSIGSTVYTITWTTSGGGTTTGTVSGVNSTTVTFTGATLPADGTALTIVPNMANFTAIATTYPPAASENTWSDGLQMLWGEYNPEVPNAKIFYTDDAGATWAEIYQYPNAAGGGDDGGHHCHFIAKQPGTVNTFFVAYGESGYLPSPLVKLVLASGTWTPTVVLKMLNGFHGLLFTKEGTLLGCGTSHATFKIDLAATPVNMISRFATGSSTHNGYGENYDDWPANGYANIRIPFQDDNGVIYGPTVNYGAADPTSGIYVSIDDGLTWTCAYRANNKGWRNAFRFCDYIIYEDQDNSYMHYSPLANAKQIESLRFDYNSPNQIIATYQSSSKFVESNGTPSIGLWGGYSSIGPATIEAVAGGRNPSSGGSMHIVTQGPTGDYRNILQLYPINLLLNKTINANTDYYMISMWVKSPNMPACIGATNNALSPGYTFHVELRNDTNNGYVERFIGNEWQQVVLTGKIGSNVVNLIPWIRIDSNSSTAALNVAFDVYVTDLQIRTSSTPFLPSDSWDCYSDPVTVPTSPDYSLATVAGCATTWSLVGEFFPPPTSQLDVNTTSTPPKYVPIHVSDLDGTHWLYLTYDAHTKLFTLVSNTGSQASLSTYTFLRADVVKFALVNTGTAVLLYIQYGLSGGTYEVVTLTTTIGAITSINVGGEATHAVGYLPGRYAVPQLFNNPIAAATVANLFGLAAKDWASSVSDIAAQLAADTLAVAAAKSHVEKNYKIPGFTLSDSQDGELPAGGGGGGIVGGGDFGNF